MVSSLENNIISGLLLVVAVLLFFLGLRTAPFVGLAIPLSMLISFVIMQMVGFTLNMVVLFSLILALGMLVDNAIVVVENIYRYRERGYDGVAAARFATGEVSTPIIASTATTLAAFLPLAFWPGLVGEFMKYLPLTLIITLSSSLFVALVILPTLASRLLETEGGARRGLPAAVRVLFLLAAAGALAAAYLVSWRTAGAAGGHRGAGGRVLPTGGQAGRPLADVPRPAVDRAPLRGGAALGVALARGNDGIGAADAGGCGGAVRRCGYRHRVLSRGHPAEPGADQRGGTPGYPGRADRPAGARG